MPTSSLVVSDSYNFAPITGTTLAFAAVNAPTITSFSPSSGLAGATVTVTGTNLTGATFLTLNGANVPGYTVVNATTVTFAIPTGATSGPIAIATAGGTATSGTPLTVLVVPTIASFTPTSAAPGATVTVTGTGFTGATLVRVNGTTAAYTVVNSTTITLTVPNTATSGAIQVTTPGGVATSSGALTVSRTFIFFEGDSNTNGGESGVNGNPDPYFTSVNQSFFSLVSAGLGATKISGNKWTGANYATYNAGTGGGTSTSRAVNLASRMNAQWDRVTYPNAILFWMTGTNDPANSVSLSAAQAAISGLRAQMNTLDVNIKIVLVSAIEPNFHQNGPTGTAYFQQLADWEAANWNGSIGANAYLPLRQTPTINRLVTNGQASGWHMLANEDRFALQMYGGIGGTGNSGVAFDSIHWGNLGHSNFAAILQPLLQNVAAGITQTVPQPVAAPTYYGFNDTVGGGSVGVVLASGIPLALYRYQLPGSTTEYTLPSDSNGGGLITVGDIAGSVTVYSIASGGYAASAQVVSPPFTSTGGGTVQIPYNDPSISENAAYAGAYSTSSSVGGVLFRSVGADPLLWFKHTSTKGCRLRWPTVMQCNFGTPNPTGIRVVVDGVLDPTTYPITDGAIVFDKPFTDGLTHTVLWYATNSQTNLWKLEAYV